MYTPVEHKMLFAELAGKTREEATRKHRRIDRERAKEANDKKENYRTKLVTTFKDKRVLLREGKLMALADRESVRINTRWRTEYSDARLKTTHIQVKELQNICKKLGIAATRGAGDDRSVIHMLEDRIRQHTDKQKKLQHDMAAGERRRKRQQQSKFDIVSYNGKSTKQVRSA